jgi:hypothetical protein
MRKLTNREKRLLLYVTLFAAVVVWDLPDRQWSPEITLSTDHYTVYSTATAEQTQKISDVAEILHTGYMGFLKEFKVVAKPHDKLRIKLFKDRDEFRSYNPECGWAEAFYLKPYCYQYYETEGINPCHWMVHEATHQLNVEVAKLSLPKWLDEGIATYFGTSRIVEKRLALGEIDRRTYPVWWIHTLATTGDLQSDKENTSVIPLRSIVSGHGGPDIDRYFNLYYLHWWSLTHFLLHYENGKYRNGVAQLLNGSCDVKAFERHIGDIDRVEREWYEYVLSLRRDRSRRRTPPRVVSGCPY